MNEQRIIAPESTSSLPSRARRLRPRASALAVAAFVTLTAAAAVAGSVAPANPFLGPPGTGAMHGDTETTDTTPNPGPGGNPVTATDTPLAAACPTILQGSDGYIVALCTSVLGQTPMAFLIDPNTNQPLATLPLAKGTLLGGVYAYLDNQNNLVMADGNNNLLRIGHSRGFFGFWQLNIVQQTSIAAAVDRFCGAPGCDGVVAVAPDMTGLVWFATQGGVAGTVNTTTGVAQSIQLGTGEQISNSLSTSPVGTSIVTDHALYQLTADENGAPHIVWRNAYDRGTVLEPGRLSQGSGASPAVFGPSTGSEYVTITDNAQPQMNLLVYKTTTGQKICQVPIFPAGASGTENAAVVDGNVIIVNSTYGYPLPLAPASTPPSAPFVGGMVRVDVRSDASGCDIVWTNTVRAATVPRLSRADGLTYVFTRNSPFGSNITTPFDSFDFVVVDTITGRVIRDSYAATGAQEDTLQMVGTITPSGVLYQGNLTGFFQVPPPAGP